MGVAVEKRDLGILSVEEYRAFLETRHDKERWQLIDGIAVMMTPPTIAHQRIGYNLARLLNDALEQHRPDLFALYEIGLTVPGYDKFLPEVDVAVIDNRADYESYVGRVYLTAEIRSESNAQEYISLKVERYSQHPDNLYNLVIAQRERRVEVWSRASGWKGLVLRSADDVIDLPEFGFRCALGDLYRGTPLA